MHNNKAIRAVEILTPEMKLNFTALLHSLPPVLEEPLKDAMLMKPEHNESIRQ